VGSGLPVALRLVRDPSRKENRPDVLRPQAKLGTRREDVPAVGAEVVGDLTGNFSTREVFHRSATVLKRSRLSASGSASIAVYSPLTAAERIYTHQVRALLRWAAGASLGSSSCRARFARGRSQRWGIPCHELHTLKPALQGPRPVERATGQPLGTSPVALLAPRDTIRAPVEPVAYSPSDGWRSQNDRPVRLDPVSSAGGARGAACSHLGFNGSR
jgi:hypothetical protein